MTDFIIKKLPYDLSSHAGLALIGKYLKRINTNSMIDPAFPVRSGVANSSCYRRRPSHQWRRKSLESRPARIGAGFGSVVPGQSRLAPLVTPAATVTTSHRSSR